ncbi:MAG TPA: GNAT family N-acetyltransferase [Pirellulales bacterium]|nr:GNAT family N-acetyltransferase [Pirellulales bacterium]
MIDQWFSTIKLPITFKQWRKLPRNHAYKYEYFGGKAWLTPRPKGYHALLDLRQFSLPVPICLPESLGLPVPPRPPDALVIRPLADGDWRRMPKVFAAAFHRVQPFASLTDKVRAKAARECLQATRDGAEGPLIAEASFVAALGAGREPVGAILITLLPQRDPVDFNAWHWREPPPADALARQMGRPHVTWIFVSPWYAGHGVGMALLDRAVAALVRLGYQELASTFLLGNESSTLWHWRAGFRLLPYPGSTRLITERVRQAREE